MTDPFATRRYDLDWLRVGAFALLILYHTGMVFVTWSFHVKTAHPSMALEPFMQLLNPWRLSLLFFVSGTATRFMAARLENGALARLRISRLAAPLLFGMYVIVPPQSWVEVNEHGFHPSLLHFYGQYLSGFHGYCDKGSCLLIPTWNHLWFVAYLLAYTLLLLGLRALLSSWQATIGRGVHRLAARALTGWGVLVWPALWLAFLRVKLQPHFPDTHALIDDWYCNALYGSVFLLGFWQAGARAFWEAVTRWRFVSLGVAALSYGVFAWIDYIAYPGDTVAPPAALLAYRTAYGLDQWAAIAALLGFAHAHLHRPSRLLTYLTLGVFPFYIIHQTVIVLAEYWLKQYGLVAPVEFAVLVCVTAAACLATYETARRVRFLRPLFGLR